MYMFIFHDMELYPILIYLFIITTIFTIIDMLTERKDITTLTGVTLLFVSC